MSELLNDMLNLEILRSICSGEGVEVNISAFSKKFKRHRNTIKSKVDELFKNRIIGRPIYPFMYLYKEYQLFVVAQADLPRNEKIDNFLKEDENIFGSYYVRDQEYNTLMMEFHSNLYEYGRWKKKIVTEKKIPPRELRYPASSLFFSTQQILKYAPYSSVALIEKRFKAGESIEMNGYTLNELGFKLFKSLMYGEGIRTNENLLSQKLDVHRKTIERRIDALMKEKIVSKPVCRYPLFLVPHNKILVYSIMEVKKSKEKVIKAIKADPHIPLAFDASIGRYNMMMFSVFFSVEDHFKWLENYDKRFSGCIGAMKNIYLSPKMITTIDQQKVSLNIIQNKMDTARGKDLLKKIN